MAAALGLFLLWLFATGKYTDWAALVVEPAKPVTVTSAPESKTSAASTASVEPSQLVKTGSDWIGQLSGTMMVGGNPASTKTTEQISVGDDWYR